MSTTIPMPAPRARLVLRALLALVLGFLWLMLMDALHVEWTVNPQYSYGWAVPFLCVFLVLKAWPDRPVRMPPPLGIGFWMIVALLALLLFPARLVQEANPSWRLIGWLLALNAIGLTLTMFYAAGGRPWLRHFAFPILFFLIALPWPTVIEAPVVQGLMRVNTTVTVELLHLFGVPALQRGNLIEIASGVVGIEEACSGIRSFQASLMLSLFFGEMNRLTFRRRLWLVVLGAGMAFVLNNLRTLWLVAASLREGLAGIAQWHDPAGVTVLVGAFLLIWGLAHLLARRGGTSAVPRGPRAPSPVLPALPRSEFFGLGALVLWIIAAEMAVEYWYQRHERRISQPVIWQVALPRDRANFAELPISENTRRILRFDEGRNARWREADGTAWQMIFLRWDPGRVGVQLAKNHTPEICLTASGRSVVSVSPPHYLEVHGLRLPFRSYVVEDRGLRVHVFYSLWEDCRPEQTFESAVMNFRSRMAAVRAGRRNLGQRSLEVIVWGAASESAAEAALARMLEQVLRVGPDETKTSRSLRGEGLPPTPARGERAYVSATPLTPP